MAEYFFELLTEEIPAWMLPHPQLEPKLRELCTYLGAEGANAITLNATPRRIAFVLRALPDARPDDVQEVKGPPKKTAYGADGAPSPALLGFLKKKGASLDDLLEKDDPYVWLRETVKGRTTAEILAERIPEIVEALRWPKMMRWGKGEHAYIRPVHSIISILDGEPLPISVFGIASGVTTTGHRTLAPSRVKVSSFSDYVSKLEPYVILDERRRQQVMAAGAIALAKEVRGVPSEDASIWAQWQYLTEYPGLVRAQFRDEYLTLPEEVLVTVMRVHQKQLPIRTSDGRLTNSFLAVLDNEGDPDGNAAYGNSFVTNARFADAQFFYETDRKRKLGDRVEQLAHLQFQEKLGNYAEKTKRIERIAKAICAELGIGATDVAAAAQLCKADLVTEMVKEFTDLQGKIGGIYAREEGLPETQWQAVYDHYLPLNVDDALPRSLCGAIVSLADKIDTLTGFFSIGARPTGSKDPFALRRAAQGVVQILLNRDKREVKIGLDRLIDLGLETFVAPASAGGSNARGATKPASAGGTSSSSGTTTPAEAGATKAEASPTKADLLAFFAERVRTILDTSAWELAYDEIAAAMEAGWASSLTDLVDRTTALKAMRNEPNFLSVLDSAKRIANITAGDTATNVDASRLEAPAEKRLHELSEAVIEQIGDLIVERQYRGALESFAAMAPELELFFKEVMVNVDDEAVRRNRMALLRRVGSAVTRIADVTKIVVDRSDYRR